MVEFGLLLMLGGYFLQPVASLSHCQSNSISNASIVDGRIPIDTSPLTPFEWPSLSAMNSTAWEYWYFDGVSYDGLSGIRIGFYRDPTFSSLGLGLLRVAVDVVWSNGKRHSSIITAENSTVEQCEGTTRGTWTGVGMESTFVFDSYSEASISVRGNAVTGEYVDGTYHLRSFSKSRYPDGTEYPSAKGSVELAPLLYWNEAVPAGNVTARMTLNGSTVSFKGVGGTDRNWAPFFFDVVADQWWWMRAVIGPYALVFWKILSPFDKRNHTFTYLQENGATVFRSATEDNVQFDLLYTGAIRGSYDDKNTGLGIKIEGEENSWLFEINHTNIVSEILPANNEHYSRFVNSANGGLIGGSSYDGVSISEQLKIANVRPST